MYNPYGWYPIIVENTIDKDIAMPKKIKDEDVTIKLNYFLEDDAIIPGDPNAIAIKDTNNIEVKPKRTRKKQEESIPVQVINETQIQGNTKIPYQNSYDETTGILKTAIAQADQLLSEVKEDIDSIRASKTLKSKYTYLTNLTASAASLIQTRITAAREINSSITQAHNLELKRAKDLKEFEQNDKNDDARMMDMYNAFINAPVGMYENGLNMPTISNMLLGPNDGSVTAVSMNTEHDGQLSPEQLRMRLENNPNIEEVVKYDPSSNRRWFEVIDKTTNQPIPNYPTSDPFLLEDVTIDTRAGIARNRNLDKVWNLVSVGTVSEY